MSNDLAIKQLEVEVWELRERLFEKETALNALKMINVNITILYFIFTYNDLLNYTALRQNNTR